VLREVPGGDLFVIVCWRYALTLQIEFSGFTRWPDQGVAVLFEDPRVVTLRGGVLIDWFGPLDVHVYQIRNNGSSSS
jgi:hypothetical protein